MELHRSFRIAHSRPQISKVIKLSANYEAIGMTADTRTMRLHPNQLVLVPISRPKVKRIQTTFNWFYRYSDFNYIKSAQAIQENARTEKEGAESGKERNPNATTNQ